MRRWRLLSAERGVSALVVGEEHRVRQNVRGDCLSKERPSTIRDHLGDDTPTAFNGPKDDDVFAVVAATLRDDPLSIERDPFGLARADTPGQGTILL